ncbi:PREDICTED: MAD2L1-binding protein [Nicrophorus vespilloides]|uniref:MAD2L1-binding protein n=1 Tax=Nicrophorus vespilloides TaxID=110193 RepID=A0ABM1NB13_NICVS|nr:PREDICTED: MAD2L1-binding protein [Nicrophorus vespilloides]
MEILFNNDTSYKCKKQLQTTIPVCVEDVILTPLTCGCLINEILKCLLYQKAQIPYPYSWLQSAINKKRNSASFTVQKHHQVASDVFNTLQKMMVNILKELETNLVLEILIVFGALPFTPKEIYTIKIPKLAKGHNEANHQALIKKHQNKILRHIFLKEDWLTAVENPLPLTNTYLFLKKNESCSDLFDINKDYEVPSNIKNTIIDLSYSNLNDECCNNLKIYTENSEMSESFKIEKHESVDDEVFNWYQANISLKGYKDCFINKTSASELW